MRKLLFSILVFICFITIADAIRLKPVTQSDLIYSGNTNTIEYKGGYLFVDTNNGSAGNFGALLTYIKNKKVVYSEEYPDMTMETVATDGENIYIYGYKKITNPSYYNAKYLFVLDNNFNVIKEEDVRPHVTEFSLNDKYNTKTALVKNNKFIVKLMQYDESSTTPYVMVVDNNLTIESVTKLANSPYKQDIESLEFEGTVSYGEKHFVITNENTCPSGTSSTENKPQVVFLNETTNNCIKSSVTLYDKNNNKEWELDFSKYGGVNDVKYNTNNIFVVADEGLIILKNNGKIETEYRDIQLGGGLFVDGDYLIFTNIESQGEICVTSFNAYDKCKDAVRHSVFYLTYNISTKIISGKGKIEVIESANGGDGVTFKITPQEGYVLSEVRVTDSNGNTVTFKDYMFTMPSADVTIEAVFVKAESETTPENPKTGAFIPYLLFVGLICVAIIFINQKNRRIYKIK